MLTLTIMTSDLVLDSTRTWMQEYNKPVQGGVRDRDHTCRESQINGTSCSLI